MLFLSEFAERPQRIRLVLHQQLGSLKLLAVFFWFCVDACQGHV